ncbi:hypothetical protein BRD03_05025 [Halobacteriales archaeon QS_9_68_17]|nr:MAG: hypothetical protein BRD03_05025 [Halobacteriales archaeon QS_9_68_17]
MNDAAKIKLLSFVGFACIAAAGSAVLVTGFPVASVDPVEVTGGPVAAPPLVALVAVAFAAVRVRQYLHWKFGGRRR